MIQNAQLWSFHTFSNLFSPKWSKMIQNAQLWSFHTFSNLFLPKWYKIIQNTQFWSFCTFSNLFPPKWSKMIQNAQLWSFHTFSNLFSPKWSKMIQNAQLWSFHTFPIFSHQSGIKSFRTPNFGHSAPFPTKVVQTDLECPILIVLHFSNLFLPKWPKIIQNAQFWSFGNEHCLVCLFV